MENQEDREQKVGVRARRKEGNRVRLIRAALEILIEQGLSELTTSSVSARVGLAQPTFYAYFDNIEDLLSSAIAETGKTMRAALRKALSHVRPDTVVHGDLLEARSLAYRDGLHALLADRLVSELLLRYRRDPTTIVGREVAAVWSEARAELESALQRFAQKLGAPLQVLRKTPLFAEIMIADTLAIAEAVLDGRIRDLDEAARGLAALNANWLSFLLAETTLRVRLESSDSEDNSGNEYS